MHDPVGVDIEGDLDLRHPARRGGYSDEVEPSEGAVARRHLALALQHVDAYRGLPVGGRREYLALARGNRRVFLDQLGAHGAKGLDTQRKRSDVQEKHVFDIAREHACLDRGADGHDLVGIDALVWLFAEQFLHQILDGGHACLPSDEDDLVDVVGRKLGVLERGEAGPLRPLDKLVHELLELGPRQRYVEMLGPRGVGGDEGQIDVGGLRGRKLALGLFGPFLETLKRHAVASKVYALVFLELVGQPVDYSVVEIVAAEVRVAACGLDLEHAFAEVQD